MTTTSAHQAIATWLRGYLAEQRIPHAELARRVDIPQQKFSRKMTGRTPFTIDELTAVVQALGINYAEFVNEVGRMRARELSRSNAQGDDTGTMKAKGETDARSAGAGQKTNRAGDVLDDVPADEFEVIDTSPLTLEPDPPHAPSPQRQDPDR